MYFLELTLRDLKILCNHLACQIKINLDSPHPVLVSKGRLFISTHEKSALNIKKKYIKHDTLLLLCSRSSFAEFIYVTTLKAKTSLAYDFKKDEFITGRGKDSNASRT